MATRRRHKVLLAVLGLLAVGLGVAVALIWSASRVLNDVSGNAAVEKCQRGLAQHYREEDQIVDWLGSSVVGDRDRYDSCESGESVETTVELAPEWSPARVSALLVRQGAKQEMQLPDVLRWRWHKYWIFVYPGDPTAPATRVRVSLAL